MGKEKWNDSAEFRHGTMKMDNLTRRQFLKKNPYFRVF